MHFDFKGVVPKILHSTIMDSIFVNNLFCFSSKTLDFTY